MHYGPCFAWQRAIRALLSRPAGRCCSPASRPGWCRHRVINQLGCAVWLPRSQGGQKHQFLRCLRAGVAARLLLACVFACSIPAPRKRRSRRRSGVRLPYRAAVQPGTGRSSQLLDVLEVAGRSRSGAIFLAGTGAEDSLGEQARPAAIGLGFLRAFTAVWRSNIERNDSAADCWWLPATRL